MGSRSARGSPSRRLLTETGLLAAIGAAVLLDSRGYPPSLTEGAPGPAFFPRLLAALLIACSVWLAIRSWRGARERGAGGGSDSGSAGASADESGAGRSRGNVSSASAAGSEAGNRTPHLGVWIAVGWIAAFLLIWPRLGTVLSVPLLVVGLMWLTGERSWRTMVSVPLAFAGFIYLVFMVLLGVPLPAGF
ncbi:MAG: tripartite tricarboxylate transporter TctB family protein [Gammaproteobacteria bacterium]|nr:tripartite tricarboxylate transporter TctB family protein [Gammaproteobacteria bacterium]